MSIYTQPQQPMVTSQCRKCRVSDSPHSCTDKMAALIASECHVPTWFGLSFMTYPGHDAVLQHILVGTQFYMPWCGCSYSTCPGGEVVLQHTLVRTQFYDMSWSGRSFMTYLGREAVQHAWKRRPFMGCKTFWMYYPYKALPTTNINKSSPSLLLLLPMKSKPVSITCWT